MDGWMDRWLDGWMDGLKIVAMQRRETDSKSDAHADDGAGNAWHFKVWCTNSVLPLKH